MVEATGIGMTTGTVTGHEERQGAGVRLGGEAVHQGEREARATAAVRLHAETMAGGDDAARATPARIAAGVVARVETVVVEGDSLTHLDDGICEEDAVQATRATVGAEVATFADAAVKVCKRWSRVNNEAPCNQQIRLDNKTPEVNGHITGDVMTLQATVNVSAASMGAREHDRQILHDTMAALSDQPT